ncbi:hypothetical protein ACQPT6_10175 [Erwinia amylovora]|uniref:hypothetical protein n=1 Tax=Erwinia amylovora TaxID=552 RepID=UPI003D08A1E6
MTLAEALQLAQYQRLLRPLDVQFARMVAAEQQPALIALLTCSLPVWWRLNSSPR